MKRILVVGFGHPYREDDGFGIRAAEEFEAMNHDPAVEVMATQELQPELIEIVSHFDLLVLLDASNSGVPGSIEVSEVKPTPSASGSFSHSLATETLLASARILYGRCPETKLITVAGGSFDFSSHLSPKVEAALPGVFSCLRELISSAKDEPASAAV